MIKITVGHMLFRDVTLHIVDDLERLGLVEKILYYTFLGWVYFRVQD